MTKSHPEIKVNQGLISPEEAAAKLKEAGFFDNDWYGAQSESLWGAQAGSHETRALVEIAEGKEPRLLLEVIQEMRDQDK